MMMLHSYYLSIHLSIYLVCFVITRACKYKKNTPVYVLIIMIFSPIFLLNIKIKAKSYDDDDNFYMRGGGCCFQWMDGWR